MKIAKRILLITSLTTLALTCVLLISAIFGAEVFDGGGLRTLLISSMLSAGTGFAISQLNVIKRNKVLGIMGLSLLCLSCLFAFIIFVSSILFNGGVFAKITGVVSVFSVLFIIVNSIQTKLHKRVLALQIIALFFLVAYDIMLSLLICGVKLFDIDFMLEVFLVLVVINVGLFIALLVISAIKPKANNEQKVPKAEKGYINLTIEQYNYLMYENQRLAAENAKLKGEPEVAMSIENTNVAEENVENQPVEAMNGEVAT